MTKIEGARVIVTSPGRNFVTLMIETSDGVRGLGDATLNGRELAVASYLARPCHPLPDRPRRASDRGHLAVSLSGRLLAARTGDDVGDRRGRHGLVGHQGEGRRAAALPAARRAPLATPRWSMGMPTEPRSKRRSRPLSSIRRRATRRSACKWACPASLRPTACRRTAISTSRPTPIFRPRISGRREKYLRSVPELFAAARDALGWDVHLLHDVHHRLTPIEAGRLGKDLEPYRPFWMEDAVVADNQESFPPDPAAHDDATRRGRGLQQRVGLRSC